MSAPQEGELYKSLVPPPTARALARAYNCLLLAGLGVTACLSPADSKLMTHDEEEESSHRCSAATEKWARVRFSYDGVVLVFTGCQKYTHVLK